LIYRYIKKEAGMTEKTLFKNERVKDIVLCSLFAALIAVCSWISIPATIPFTLQTFGVFVTVGMLGGRKGLITVLLYIIMGLIGLPVFSNFTGGFAILAGNTGGYIIGFLGIAGVMWLFENLFGKNLWSLASSMVLGLLVCYAFGTAWFMVAYARSAGAVGLATVLSWCVFPFIVPDLLKISLAIVLVKRLKPAIQSKK
jgi:biotin transport system substrate-specific component